MGRAFIILLSLCLVRFFPFLLGQALYWGDNYSLMVPGKVFTANWLGKGLLPQWNPLILGGIPWIGDINQSVLYPSTLLFTLFPAALALNMAVISHVIITGLGMWQLLRDRMSSQMALIGGVLWAFSTQVTGSLNNLSTLQSIAWTPWVIWAGTKIGLSRKYQYWFSFMITIQLLGGYPQHVIYTGLITVIWQLIESGQLKREKLVLRVIKPWITTIVLSIGLAAFIWLPFAKTFFGSTRMNQNITQAQSGSMHPLMLIKAISPYIFDLPLLGMRWGPAWSGQPNMAVYITWLSILVCLVSWKRLIHSRSVRYFIGLVFGLVALSMGRFLPGYSFLQRWLPILVIGRYPSIFMVYANIILIYLSTKMMANKLPRACLGWKKRLVIISSLFLVFSCFFGVYGKYWLSLFNFGSFHTPERDYVIVMVWLLSMVFGSGLTWLAIIIWQRRRLFLLALILGLDMIVFTQGGLFFGKSEIYKQNFPIMANDQAHFRALTQNFNLAYTDFGAYWEALAIRQPFSHSEFSWSELADLGRLQKLRDSYTPDWNMPAGIYLINGYTTLLPSDFAALWTNPGQETRINYLPEIELENWRLDDWAVGYYLVDKQFGVAMPATRNLRLVEEQANLAVYNRSSALPRIRWISGRPIEDLVVVETPNKIELVFENKQAESAIIIADRYDPDWQTTIYDQMVETQNYRGMRLVEVPTATISLVQEYRPKAFYFGILITVMTGLVIVIVEYKYILFSLRGLFVYLVRLSRAIPEIMR